MGFLISDGLQLTSLIVQILSVHQILSYNITPGSLLCIDLGSHYLHHLARLLRAVYLSLSI
jgi:hypothetical protein